MRRLLRQPHVMTQPDAEALPFEAPRLPQSRVFRTDRPAAAAVVAVATAAVDRHPDTLLEAVQHRQGVDVATVEDRVDPFLPESVVDLRPDIRSRLGNVRVRDQTDAHRQSPGFLILGTPDGNKEESMVLERTRLDGKVAIVTGGGRGLG